MSDIRTTIRLEDGFTEPLKDLATEARNASRVVGMFKESIEEVSEEFDFAESKAEALNLVIDDMSRKYMPIFQKRAKEAKEAIHSFGLNIKFTAMQINGILSNKFERTVDRIWPKLFKASLYVTKALEKTKKSLIDISGLIGGLLKNIGSKALSFGGKGLLKVLEYGASGVGYTAGMFKGTKEAIKKYGFKETFNSLMFMVSEWAKGIGTRALKFLGNVKKNIVGIAQITKEAINEHGLKNTLWAYKEIAKEFATTKMDSLLNKLNNSKFTKSLKEFTNVIQNKAFVTGFKAATYGDMAIGGIRGVFSKITSKGTWEGIRKSILVNGFKAAGYGDMAIERFMNSKIVNTIRTGFANSKKNIIDNADRLSFQRYAGMMNEYGYNVKHIAGFSQTAEGQAMRSALSAQAKVGPMAMDFVRATAGEVKRRLNQFKTSLGDATKSGLKKGFNWLRGTTGYKMFKDFAGGMVKTMAMDFGANLALALGKKLKDAGIRFGQSLANAINASLDELNLSDKFSGRFGISGDQAKVRAYALAGQLGENSTMVGELAARAAHQGIGTADFERVMFLSDKIGKLSLGETTESAANTLLSNIKSGHDAETIAQLLGGGNMMARQLRMAGYERALNMGDLNKALTIAESIAEKSGFTKENYENATNSMSQNFKWIMNNVDNIKQQLSEIYVKQVSPAVARIKEMMQSETFKYVMQIIKNIFELLGKIVNWMAQKIINNLKLIAVLMGVGIVLKTYLLIRNAQLLLGLVGFFKPILLWIIKKLGVEGVLGSLYKIIKAEGIAAIRAKAISFAKIAAPIAGAVAVFLAWAGIIYKLTGYAETHGTTFGGYLLTIFQLLYDVMYDLITLVKDVFVGLWIGVQGIAFGITRTVTGVITGIVNFIFYQLDRVLWLVEKAASLIDKDDVVKKAREGLDNMRLSVSNALDKPSDTIWENMKSTAGYLGGYKGLMDIGEDIDASIRTNGTSFTDMLKRDLLPSLDNLDFLPGISTDTSKISALQEQEEDLKWLKQFSDRQIMSQINNSTSNYRHVTINGASQQAVDSAARMNVSAIPGRALY